MHARVLGADGDQGSLHGVVLQGRAPQGPQLHRRVPSRAGEYEAKTRMKTRMQTRMRMPMPLTPMAMRARMGFEREKTRLRTIRPTTKETAPRERGGILDRGTPPTLEGSILSVRSGAREASRQSAHPA